jgi:hypothetical protein
MRFGHANPLCNGFSPAIEALKHHRIMEGKLAHALTQWIDFYSIIYSPSG